MLPLAGFFGISYSRGRMPIQPLFAIPRRIISGDTVSFCVKDARYPAPAWKLAFSISGAVTLSFDSVADTDAHIVTISPKDGNRLVPGQYAGALVFTETGTGVRKTERIGRVFVLADPTRQRDKLSIEISLENIEETIEKLTTRLNTSTTIAQQASTKLDIEKALVVRDSLRVRVAAERRKLGEFDSTGSAKVLKGYFR